MLPIAIGADDAAFELKKILVKHIQERGYEVTDYTRESDIANTAYPDIAYEVAHAIKDGKHQRGILICGTGIGMSITANKVSGIRAAQCHDTFSAERARKSNNAQIVTLGSRVIGAELAKTIVDSWLASEFEGGRSVPKVEKIGWYENLEKQG
ncbi:ribose 5-phosphate isomerase B [Rouxiella sp. Mn2063]|uniref:ribose 5-phosphate isomerase B n=1 Tax=Rouxiella sp. Mn2063 TaxID=3395262 RepID=UPI003BC40D80